MHIGIDLGGTKTECIIIDQNGKETNLIKGANSIWLNEKPLKKDIEEKLNRKIYFENDANCFALSEAFDGAGNKHNIVFGVIIGTGVGGSLVINKKTTGDMVVSEVLDMDCSTIHFFIKPYRFCKLNEYIKVEEIKEEKPAKVYKFKSAKEVQRYQLSKHK